MEGVTDDYVVGMYSCGLVVNHHCTDASWFQMVIYVDARLVKLTGILVFRTSGSSSSILSSVHAHV